MKKILIVFTILCYAFGHTFSQVKFERLTLDYGEQMPNDKQLLVKIIGETDDKIYGLAMQKDDYFIQVFESRSMKQLSSEKIIIPELNDKEVDFQEVFLLKGKLYVIGSVYNNKEKIFHLMATTVSEKGVLDKKSKELFKSEVAKKSEKEIFILRKRSTKMACLSCILRNFLKRMR
jgi:hypothetical protein